jgi:hypothetical protein
MLLRKPHVSASGARDGEPPIPSHSSFVEREAKIDLGIAARFVELHLGSYR